MGLKLVGPDEGPFPRPVHLVVRCDEAISLICRLTQTFAQGDYIEQRRAASAEGWIFRANGTLICPECAH